MPKYYCDYCDTYLTHDSPSVRKTHCNGRKHKENVRVYYQKWLEEQVQKLVDDTTAAFKAGSGKSGSSSTPAAPASAPPATAVPPGPAPGPGMGPAMGPMPMGPGMGPMAGPMPHMMPGILQAPDDLSKLTGGVGPMNIPKPVTIARFVRPYDIIGKCLLNKDKLITCGPQRNFKHLGSQLCHICV